MPKIRYQINSQTYEIEVSADRILIGSGPFAHIRLDKNIAKIAATIRLINGLMEFTCIEESPSIYSEGDKLQKGENWLLDKNRNITIGN
ncbi:MAG: hypothetical protein EP319_07755, partial [Deltaproteobacteria bacterium]